MFIIVGLGNPGKEYESTYHNVGFLAVDKIAKEYSVKISKKECSALIGTFNLKGEKIVLVKPQTFMNLSGDAVISTVKKFGASAKDVVVIVDDVAIPAGTIRVKSSGSSGLHNGLKSIIHRLETEDFTRIRVGFGPKPENIDLANFVLSKIPRQSLVREGIDKAVMAVKHLIETNDFEDVCQKYNGNAKL